MRGNVMDLAIGVIIGAAFQAIVKSLVDDVISPLIGLVAKTDFSYLSFTINGVDIRYGAFITAVINFVIMALVIFLFVKMMNTLAEKGKHKEEKVEELTTKTCPYCCTEIKKEATRCPNCTSVLEEAAPENPVKQTEGPIKKEGSAR